MKIYAVQNISIFGSYNEKYFTTRQKAREYLKECYKADKEKWKSDIPKLEDMKKGEKRRDITTYSKRIIEIEVEE